MHELLAAALGTAPNEGYDEVTQHLLNDDYLSFGGSRDGYGRDFYKIAFLGEPSIEGFWQLQFGGHQLAVSNTYSEGQLVGATPSFRGTEPLTFEMDGIIYEPQRQEWDAFVALLESLDAEQRGTAELARTMNDLLLGPGSDA